MKATEEGAMPVLEEILEANEQYAAGFTKSELPLTGNKKKYYN